MLKRISLLSATCVMAVGIFFACNDKHTEVVKPITANLSSARTAAELSKDPEFGKFYSLTPVLYKSLDAKLKTMSIAQQKTYIDALPKKITATGITVDRQAAMLGVTKETLLTYATSKFTLGKRLITRYPNITNKEYLTEATKQYTENKYSQYFHQHPTDCFAWKECWQDANFEYAVANLICVHSSETIPQYLICEAGIYAGWAYKSYYCSERNDPFRICPDLFIETQKKDLYLIFC